jgi:hypothetical protein
MCGTSGRIGVALPAAASDEQGVARAERGDLAPGLRDCVEGAEAAARSTQSIDRQGQEQGRSGDGRGAGTGGFRMGDQPGVSMLSVNERLTTLDSMRPICRLGANPEGGKRAASCRPLRSWPLGRRSGRVATEPCPPPGPRIIVERGEAVGKPWGSSGLANGSELCVSWRETHRRISEAIKVEMNVNANTST